MKVLLNLLALDGFRGEDVISKDIRNRNIRI